METIISKFSEFINQSDYNNLPLKVVNYAKYSILDLIGVAIGGFHMPFPQKIVNYLSSLGGKAEATLISQGKQIKVPAIHASFGNAVCGHALDMDNGCRFGGGHMADTIIPAALAGSELQDSNGQTLILATVMGHEIQGRIGQSILPYHFQRGFHQTGTLGPFGAAAAVGKIYGLDSKKLTMALALAGLQGAGLLEVLHDGSMAKPLHPGKAAMAGILSVELAKNGAEGPSTILEGKKGFYKAMSDKVNMDGLYKDLGEDYYILKTYIKIHASCRHTHPAIDAILKLKKEHSIDLRDISKINVSTYSSAVSFTGSTINPKTAEGAKFSLPFSLCLAAYFSDAKMSRFSMDNIKNEEIQSAASRVNIRTDDRWSQLYPNKRGATVEITTKDGNRFSTEIELAKGDPENPLSPDEILEKFRDNTSRMKKDTSEKLINIILELEKRKVSELTACLVI